MFTRKQHNLIAKAIRNSQGGTYVARAAICRELCKLFKEDNLAFRSDIFMAMANAIIDDDPFMKNRRTNYDEV